MVALQLAVGVRARSYLLKSMALHTRFLHITFLLSHARSTPPPPLPPLPSNLLTSYLKVADKVKMLFAGIAQPGMPGGVRAYPIGQGPPPGPGQGAGGAGGGGGGAGGSGGGAGGELCGDFQEYGCLSLPVSCMVLNHDGSLLFVGGEDGVLAMYCVAEDPKAAERKVGALRHCPL